MVCKRSLYCWKNGPCASDEARKQIWEDNIKFRQNLKNDNLSDHYWSFQISRNLCLCLEADDSRHGRQFPRKYKNAPLQQLYNSDCTSVAHDCNGLKFRNCYIHWPSKPGQNELRDDKKTDFSPSVSLLPKQDANIITKHSIKPIMSHNKAKEEKGEYCHRYKNTLSNQSRLKANGKIKFPSQLNLTSGNKNAANEIQKKVTHSSCENVLTCTENENKRESQGNERDENSQEENKSKCVPEETGKKYNEEKAKDFKQKIVKGSGTCNFQENYSGWAPVSRTTRKMLKEDKKLPFATYGCNNTNNDIGTKKTHNVLASKLEVYPTALLAKQNKKNMIMKYLENEKSLQQRCTAENPNKEIINHSSLWSIEYREKENKGTKKKAAQQILPIMRNIPKKQTDRAKTLDSLPYKTYRKPQVYFY